MNPGLFQQLLHSPQLGRRQFLSNTGRGILAASVVGQIAGCASNAQKTPQQSAASDTTPVKLPPLDHPSEPALAPPPAPLHPDKRVGYALVGLGHLTLDELLPAFGQCNYSKPVALVSGDAAKAKKVAGQYGLDEKNIYNYKNYDEIKQVERIIMPDAFRGTPPKENA